MTAYLAHTKPDPDQIQTWVDQFHRDGFLFLQNVLPPDLCAQLRQDLDTRLELDNPLERNPNAPFEICMRLFETSQANLSLFDLEPIVSFAEALIGNDAHVIHNNSFKTRLNGGGITGWHQDDSSHLVVTEGPAPTNIHLPVLFFTCNYYLTDVDAVDKGPTQLVPGSHLLGRNPFADDAQPDYTSCLGPAGSVVMFNNQVWHRGGPNESSIQRYITQITYARRIIGHMYYPFMNYQMPAHVYEGADDRRRRLLGFKAHGPYG